MTLDELIDEVWDSQTTQGMSGGELHFAQALAKRVAEAVAQEFRDAEALVYDPMAEVKRLLDTDVPRLLDKARALVTLMDEAETQHGGLIGGVTLRAKNDLRLELSRWKS